MKNFSNSEKIKAADLLRQGKCYKILDLKNTSLQYTFASAEDFAYGVCMFMLEEYPPEAPINSYEYERHLFWLNVKKLIDDYSNLSIERKEKFLNNLEISLGWIFEKETNTDHKDYSGLSNYKDEYVHWLERKVLKSI